LLVPREKELLWLTVSVPTGQHTAQFSQSAPDSSLNVPPARHNFFRVTGCIGDLQAHLESGNVKNEYL